MLQRKIANVNFIEKLLGAYSNTRLTCNIAIIVHRPMLSLDSSLPLYGSVIRHTNTKAYLQQWFVLHPQAVEQTFP